MTEKHGVFPSANTQLQVTTGRVVSIAVLHERESLLLLVGD